MLRTLPTLLLLAFVVAPARAQEAGFPGGAVAQQSLRPYWHVFIAYAIVIALVLLWIVSISRRLRDVEERLRDAP